MEAPTDIDELDWMLEMEMEQGEEEREEVYYRGPGGRFFPHGGAEEPFTEDQFTEEDANAALRDLEGSAGEGLGGSGSGFSARPSAFGAAGSAQPSAFSQAFGDVACNAASNCLVASSRLPFDPVCRPTTSTCRIHSLLKSHGCSSSISVSLSLIPWLQMDELMRRCQTLLSRAGRDRRRRG